MILTLFGVIVNTTVCIFQIIPPDQAAGNEKVAELQAYLTPSTILQLTIIVVFWLTGPDVTSFCTCELVSCPQSSCEVFGTPSRPRNTFCSNNNLSVCSDDYIANYGVHSGVIFQEIR